MMNNEYRIQKGVEQSLLEYKRIHYQEIRTKSNPLTENRNAPFQRSADQYVIHARPVGLIIMIVSVVTTY